MLKLRAIACMGTLAAACASTLIFLLPGRARAEPPSICQGTLLPAAVVRCALAQSPEVQTEQQELKALAGRRIAAGTLLPNHPVLTLSFAQRRASASEAPAGATFFNWYVTLAQELEIAGQRGVRLQAVDAALAAQVRRVAVVEQETAAAALVAYYTLLAARAQQRLAADLLAVAEATARVASGRAQQALLSPVEADVARAEASRLGLARIEADRRAGAASAALAAMLTTEPELAGELLPDPLLLPDPGQSLAALQARALLLRGEVAAAEQEQRMHIQEARLQRRLRVPNLTLSAYVQRDGLDELTAGGGVSLPLPLPSPLAPSRRGETAEAMARADKAGAILERIRRRVQREVQQAYSAQEAQGAALRLLPAELIERARADLRALAQALSARQLPLKEALLWQRSLIDLLQADLHVRLEFVLARIELLRAAGLLSPGERP